MSLYISDGTIRASYPSKTVSKKTSRLSITTLSSQTAAVIPTNNSQNMCHTQLLMAAEVLLGNKSRVVEILERQPEDLSVPSRVMGFPSPLRVLHNIKWLDCFITHFKATQVDEYIEIMDSISTLVAARQPTLTDLPDSLYLLDQNNNCNERKPTYSIEERGTVQTDNSAEYLSYRNTHFLNSKSSSLPGSIFTEESQAALEMSQWGADDCESTSCIFDSEITQILAEGFISRPDILWAALQSRDKTGIGDYKDNKITDSAITDYRYFTFHFDRNITPPAIFSSPVAITSGSLSNPYKKSRDEHLEVEVSTKSDEGHEELQPVPLTLPIDSDYQLFAPMGESRGQKKKRNKRAKKKEKEGSYIAETVVEVPETDSPLTDHKPLTNLDQDPKLKLPLLSSQSISPKFTSTVINTQSITPQPYPDSDVDEEAENEEQSYVDNNENNKLKHKLKEECKDFLRSQLNKVSTTDNLEELEKTCLAEINGLDSLSKKMKQKARKRLRLEVDTERSRREQEQEKQTEEFEDDELEDEEAALEYLLANYQDLPLTSKDLKSIGLAGARLLLGQRSYCII